MKKSMNTLRRLLALVLVLVMTCSLFAGCNKEETKETVPQAPSESTQQTVAPTDAPEAPTEQPTEAPTEPAVTVPAVIMGTVNADNLNVRSEPYSTADILKRLAINTRIEVLEQKIVDGVNWGRVAEGWINLNYVTIDGEGTGSSTVVENENAIGSGNTGSSSVASGSTNAVITATELNIREKASADSDSVGVYLKGDKVKVLERNGDWGRTDMGWISLKYVDLSGTVPTTTSGSSSSSSSSSSSTGTNNTSVSNGNNVILGYGTVATVSSLAVRTGPSTSYAQKTFIRRGETHAYYQVSGDWVRISKGWVNANYLTIEYAVASGTVAVVSAGELNVREAPNYESNPLATYKKGAEVTILEVSGVWGKVEYAAGQYGWINLDFVTLPTIVNESYTTGDGVVTADYLHYRAGAGTSYAALGTYKAGDRITVTELNGNWGKTSLGWVNLKYVQMDDEYTAGIATVTASSLNIRSKPSASGDDLGSLKKGDEVTILEVENGWGRIEYKKGEYGWINLKYIMMSYVNNGTSGSTSTSSTKYKVTVQTPGNGTASVSSSTYAQGSTVTVSAKPATGYALKSVSVVDANGNAVSVVNEISFTMPASNVTVTVEFEPATPYAINNSWDAAQGTVITKVAGATVSSAAAGQTVTLSVAANTGFALSSITVKKANGDLVSVSNNSFTMPASEVTVYATFAASTATYYSVNIGATDPAGKATITPSVNAAAEGEKVILNIAPATGYTLKSVSVKKGTTDVTVSGTGNVRTFTMPKGEVTVTATLEANEYSVGKSVTGSGLVSFTSSKCAAGTPVTITATPSDGYSVKEIKVYGPNNVIVPVNSSNAFTMPGYNVTVYVTFEKTPYAITLSNDGNGTVEASKTAASVGTTITLTAKPNDGYELDKITVNGTAISGTSFAMPESAVTVNATFKLKTYSITVNSTSNGSIAVSPASAKMGETFKVTVSPATGYELAAGGLVVKCGSTVVSATSVNNNEYSFTMPAGNVTVSATFAAIGQYVVNEGQATLRKEATAESENLGTIAAGTSITALAGSTDTWIKTTVEGKTGWIHISALTAK